MRLASPEFSVCGIRLVAFALFFGSWRFAASAFRTRRMAAVPALDIDQKIFFIRTKQLPFRLHFARHQSKCKFYFGNSIHLAAKKQTARAASSLICIFSCRFNSINFKEESEGRAIVEWMRVDGTEDGVVIKYRQPMDGLLWVCGRMKRIRLLPIWLFGGVDPAEGEIWRGW